jgi:hypothetical protein
MQAFINFPLPPGLTGLCDANWGPQDQSKPNPKHPLPEIDIFKSRSISGFLTWINGPVMWTSKRQTYTARSSAEAEIYATDECTKNIIHLKNIIEDLNLTSELISGPVPIYNDDAACVCWSKNTTTKGLRHVQIRENAVREAISLNWVDVKHIAGENNTSDIFTKEDKDTAHYIMMRDSFMVPLDDTTVDTSVEQSEANNAAHRTGGCHVGSPDEPLTVATNY